MAKKEFKAFFIDEPRSNLDAKLRNQMRTEIMWLQRQLGTTIVFVTHDQVKAMTMGDRITVMSAGEVYVIDTQTTQLKETLNEGKHSLHP